MRAIRIPDLLRDTPADEDPAFQEWLAALPETVDAVASEWELDLDDPFEPGGRCAWVAPARNRAGDQLAIKVAWRHWEAEHEADGLRFWDGNGAVRCLAMRELGDATALLLERCVPGVQLKSALPELEHDVVIAGLLRRLWARQPPDGHQFRPLQYMCDRWASSFETSFCRNARGLDPGLAREAIATFRELPQSADSSAVLCTDLHAENVLAAQREPWLVIDPKPFVGDPAYDVVPHMLNCDQRLAVDPVGLSRRMAALLGLDPRRVSSWLFARCTQEALEDLTMREPSRRLAR